MRGSCACLLVGRVRSWPSGGQGNSGLRRSLGACLQKAGAVSPPSWLSGLRHPNTGACRLLGGAKSWP